MHRKNKPQDPIQIPQNPIQKWRTAVAAAPSVTKEMESPRFRAIIRATSGRRRRAHVNIKSFSHELDSRGARLPPLRRLRGLTSAEDIMKVIRTKFNRLKEEINAELGVYAADLVSILETSNNDHPEWRKPLGDLLVISQECAEMSPEEFWLKCEGIVQRLDDRRQEMPMGTAKQAHTRILFILTRCTRLLQFQKEGVWGEDSHAFGLHQFSDLGFYAQGLKTQSDKEIKERLITKRLHEYRLSQDFAGSTFGESAENTGLPGSRSRISSWKKLPSAAEKNQKKSHETTLEELLGSLQFLDKVKVSPKEKADRPSENRTNLKEQKVYTDYSGDQQDLADEKPMMICRICDSEIPTLHAEGHFKVCTISDRCDFKGLSINERLERVAEVLEKFLGSSVTKCLHTAPGNNDNARISKSHASEDASGLSHNQNILSHLSSVEEAMECPPKAVGSSIASDVNDLQPGPCNTHTNIAVDQGIMHLSSGSITPQSPLMTPQTRPIHMLLIDWSAFSKLESFHQIRSLLTIVRCIKNIDSNDYNSLENLSSHLEDLNAVIDDRKADALVVETFGRRIEKLLQEKFIHLCGQIDDGNKDSPSIIDEDGSVESDTSRSSLTSPFTVKLKDRTSIEDFEIIKPISRGAFGRVFLAKKRVTGDRFAIKVLKKSDMVRKNTVESILAERNILISARNPFVVRFFYSFTCRENLYLVMEYLNGGDLYSMLRNLGCLDEEMARIYIAEVVLALEYLHSLNVIHRDLKPDNLLISRDGHIKLTDFGLSTVGLINSTDDLSGPDVSSSVLLNDYKTMQATERAQKREQRQKQSAIGTPDYLAPEILLGMAHGPSADWWSVGVILFELLVGIPPFNAEHPQIIFDNIMNRDIPWPHIPEEMSYEAHDLIDKFLIQNPLQRLGTTGAAEVKSHPFFKNINWDVLAWQKAAFIPSTQSAEDTSYFASRHAWNEADDQIHLNDYDNMTDECNQSCSSSSQSDLDESQEDEFGNLADFANHDLSVKYTFSNFSFKNLSQLASINYDLITKCSEDSANASNP